MSTIDEAPIIHGNISCGTITIGDVAHIPSSSSTQYEITTQLSTSSNRQGILELSDSSVGVKIKTPTQNVGFLLLQPQNGAIFHSHGFWNPSDDRLKSYETDVSNATDTIMKLKPKFYKKHPGLITDDPTPDLSGVQNFDEYGFVAQELNEDPVLSHFVNQHAETGMYHVNYVEMIPLLAQTIKELNERISILEN